MTATTLVSAAPTTVSSWREHFFQYRRRFFAGTFVYLALLTGNSFVTFGIPLLNPLRAGQAFQLLLLGTGFVMASERAQTRIAALAAALLALNLGIALSGLSFQLTLR